MTKLMTLAEALATGRPFKHKDWVGFVDMQDVYSVTIGHSEFRSSEWEIQEEEKPPMRVWECKDSGEVRFGTDFNPLYYTDKTTELASALAPLIKKELNL